MRRDINYRWKSRPLHCKLLLHSQSGTKQLEDTGLWFRQCVCCPYYWYI